MIFISCFFRYQLKSTMAIYARKKIKEYSAINLKKTKLQKFNYAMIPVLPKEKDF